MLSHKQWAGRSEGPATLTRSRKPNCVTTECQRESNLISICGSVGTGAQFSEWRTELGRAGVVSACNRTDTSWTEPESLLGGCSRAAWEFLSGENCLLSEPLHRHLPSPSAPAADLSLTLLGAEGLGRWAGRWGSRKVYSSPTSFPRSCPVGSCPAGLWLRVSAEVYSVLITSKHNTTPTPSR